MRRPRPLIREWQGLLGVASSLQIDIHEIEGQETESAVDNELMLLWWDSYPPLSLAAEPAQLAAPSGAPDPPRPLQRRVPWRRSLRKLKNLGR